MLVAGPARAQEAPPADTTVAPVATGTGGTPAPGPSVAALRVGFGALHDSAARPVLDTVAGAQGGRQRPRAIEYSDWYNRRLTIHRWASYATVPLFVAQYLAGQELLTKKYQAAPWARQWHPALANGIAALFTVNSVTGLWNLWDARHDPAGRVPRTLHSLLMLASDAGFVLVGQVQNDGGISDAARQQHKQRAIASMSAAMLGYLIMLPPFRRN